MISKGGYWERGNIVDLQLKSKQFVEYLELALNRRSVA